MTGVVLTIAKTATQPPAKGEPEGDEQDDGVVAEIGPGELDKPFLIGTSVFIAVLALLVLGGAGYLISRIKLTDTTQVVGVDKWVSGTNAEAIAGVTQLLAVAAGTVLVFVGGWLAALEVRGRLRRKLTTTVSGRAAVTRGVATDAGEAAAKVIEVLKGARGTIAVLSVGAILIFGALFAATQVAEDSHGPATPSTPTPSVAPTDGATTDTPNPTDAATTGTPGTDPTSGGS